MATLRVPPVRPAPGTEADDATSGANMEADLLVDRIMARLDGPLQVRLRETVGRLAVEHFRKLEPLLRDEIDSVVRRAVDEAFAQETGLG